MLLAQLCHRYSCATGVGMLQLSMERTSTASAAPSALPILSTAAAALPAFGRSSGTESPGAKVLGSSTGPVDRPLADGAVLDGPLDGPCQPSVSASHTFGSEITVSPMDDPAMATTIREPTSTSAFDCTDSGASSPTLTVSLCVVFLPATTGSVLSTMPQTALEQPEGASVSAGAPDTPSRTVDMGAAEHVGARVYQATFRHRTVNLAPLRRVNT